MTYTDNLKTNLEVLIYMIKRQQYYTQIIIAANNNAGSFIKNNKLYFFEFYDIDTHQKHSLTAYEILYSIKKMYLYTIEQYNTSSLTLQNYQVFGKKYEQFKAKENVYRAFNKLYEEASYYGGVYTNIQNSMYYKNMGLDGCFMFTVPKHLFTSVPQEQIKKAYTNQQIFNIYHSLAKYLP